MQALGFKTLVAPENQSVFITSFAYPSTDFDFFNFYNLLKREGFVIYPGKLTDTPCFRIGNIGEVYPADMHNLLDAVNKVLNHA
jgi:2-aminoethylphosphonate-pyruvate transaminase